MQNILEKNGWVVALVVAIIALFTPAVSSVITFELGNKTDDFWDAASYKVSGTEVISSSRGISATTLAASGATIIDEFTQGGLILSTSTTATATVFRESDLLTFSGWDITVNLTDLTYTFPASSTLSAIVPSVGDSRTWTMRNATSTAGIDVIFAAATGSNIKAVGGGALTLDEDSFGEITLTRRANGHGGVGDIDILVKFPDAD